VCDEACTNLTSITHMAALLVAVPLAATEATEAACAFSLRHMGCVPRDGASIYLRDYLCELSLYGCTATAGNPHKLNPEAYAAWLAEQGDSAKTESARDEPATDSSKEASEKAADAAEDATGTEAAAEQTDEAQGGSAEAPDDEAVEAEAA